MVPVHCFARGSIVLLRRHCTALMWMKSYLNDRTQRVAVGSVVSNAMPLQCSVSQSSVLGSRLYCIFAKPIGEICRHHNFSHQSYTDDTQVYLVIKPFDNWKNIFRRLETCLSDVSVWMSSNMLKLNQYKKELWTESPREGIFKMLSLHRRNQAHWERGGGQSRRRPGAHEFRGPTSQTRKKPKLRDCGWRKL